MRAPPWLMLSWVLLSVPPIHAVLIDSGDGTGNTSAPSPDPGWDHVGTPGGKTAVYLGNGVVLTADHVGPGDLRLGGVVYPLVPGSDVRIDNGDGTEADLVLFAVHPQPPLPPLTIAASPPSVGTPVVMIGRGRNRGAATSWDPDGGLPFNELDGYEWAAGSTIRWGTNEISDLPGERVFDTEVIETVFDASGTVHEAQAVNGDSGGALFVWDGGSAELAGILLAVGYFEGQPPETSFYTQTTIAADLSFYRDQIEDAVAMPEPGSAGLALGAGLLLALAAARRPSRRGD